MWLTVFSDAASPESRALSTGSLTIGRGADCDIVLDDQFVSSHHARLDIDTRGVSITDLGSRNGTYVGQEIVKTNHALEPGSEVRVGNSTLRISAEQPTSVGPGIAVHRDAPAVVPQPPAAGTGLGNVGAIADHGDVNLDGYNVAGRDIYLQEGFKLTTKMRASAKTCIRLGVIVALAGFATFGYFVLTWNSKIFDAVRNSSTDAQPNLPSPYPWLPLGLALSFAGIVLVVVGLLIPRDRIVKRQGR
jgi:hypothetical protein